jgi:hypothetical protein
MEEIPYLNRVEEAFVEAVGRKRHRRRLRPLLILGGILVLAAAVPAAAAIREVVFAPPPGQLEAERAGDLDPGSVTILRTLETPPGVTWTAVTYRTSKYTCLDLYGSLEGADSPSGAVGGCDPDVAKLPPGGFIGGPIGGLRVGERWYNVAFGRAGPQVARVKATFSDGHVVVDEPVDGIWIVVASEEERIVRIEAES